MELNLPNIVLSKYSKGDTPTEIHHHLNGGISLAAIKSGCQIIRQSDSIQLLGTHGGPRIVMVLKRISKYLKVIFAENRRHQLENF